ncbi:MAG: single-stranded-DNA-specific exonuclease RecJ [Desulfobulbaceae bacterium]|nr:single-stranded-DNA-specific exonuclease RecJ [Desulfobulbaceae bacterium]
MNYSLRPYPESICENTCEELARALNIPPAAAVLLCQRGISTPKQATEYLSPKLKRLPSPFLLKGMPEGVQLIVQAMEEQQPVIVYGDYDVDGICATALLVDFLSLLHLEVHWHIPNRLTEGYGLSSETVRKLSEKHAAPALLITVDNGISAAREVAEARSAGFHVLVTDHHEPPEVYPPADALINPKQKECGFPCKELSGAGVAFYLVIALRSTLIKNGFWQENSSPNLKNYLDLVALGTVADVMPLVGVNRILVRAGLEILTERRRPGIWALCEHIGLKEGDITSEDISFRIAPRINASGRLGTPETAAGLFMSKHVENALEFAKALDLKNMERRRIEAEIIPGAINQSHQQVSNRASALVVYDASWHPGVIGIVASRLCEKFMRPAIVLTDDPTNNDHVKGSGRTTNGINIYDAVEECRAHLVKFGGHPKAIGLSLRREVLLDFTKKFCAAVDDQAGDVLNQPGLIKYDHHLQNGANIVNPEFIGLLRQFEPFGEKNPEPVFLIKDVRLTQVALIKGDHLKFSLQLNGKSYRGIGFGMGEHLDVTRQQVDLTFTFKHSVYRGRERVELIVVDIAPTY